MTGRGAAVVAALAVLVGGAVALVATGRDTTPREAPGAAVTAGATPLPDGPDTASGPASPSPSASPERADRGLVGASTVGQPWGADGLLSFRGNPTRTWYGRGPVPDEPEVLWRYPDRAMCTEEVTGYVDVPVGGTGGADAEGGEGRGGGSDADVDGVVDDSAEEPAERPSPTATPTESPSPTAAPTASPSPTPSTTPSPVTKLWCGTGWTGQPAVRELPDGTTEVVFGGFDGAVHFVDGATGRPTRPKFQTGDMIKGSVTLDPDGLPLVYFGSRDGYLRIVALDRAAPTELWRLEAHPQGVWNNDWDGNPVVIGDLLLEGGEDSWFHAVRLHKDVGDDGLVRVAPEVLAAVPGFDEQLFADVGDANVSIESSVAVFEDRVYFANSGGRVVGLDLREVEAGTAPLVFDYWVGDDVDASVVVVEAGTAPLVFDYWVGDDVDASVVVDEEGMLYVAAELERFLPRAEEVGQLVKLDPYADDDPRLWGLAVPPLSTGGDGAGGIWATPALHEDVLYVTTHPGDLLAVDRTTGEVVWQQDIGYHEWSSPVVVDDTLVVGACQAGGLLAWSVSDPRAPRELWRAQTPSGACIESTPAVWQGRIYVGSRDGFFYGFE